MFMFAGCVVLAAVAVGQNAIKSIRVLPSEPITAACEAPATACYLQVGDRKELTDAEIGAAIRDAIDAGQSVLVYPATTRGVFVSAQCVN
jgi:hypothetical protein